MTLRIPKLIPVGYDAPYDDDGFGGTYNDGSCGVYNDYQEEEFDDYYEDAY